MDNCTQILDSSFLDNTRPPEIGRLKIGSLIINGVTYDIYRGDNIIGRDELSDIVVRNTAISSKHAVIEVEDWDTHLLYDVGSTNKTRLGKVVLKPNVRYNLQGGDDIMFADLKAKYTKLDKPHMVQSNDDTDSETGSESMLNCDHFDVGIELDEDELIQSKSSENIKNKLSIQPAVNSGDVSESLSSFNNSSVYEETNEIGKTSKAQVVEASVDESTDDEDDFFVLPSQTVKEFNSSRPESNKKISSQILTEDVFAPDVIAKHNIISSSSGKKSDIENSKDFFEIETQEYDGKIDFKQDVNVLDKIQFPDVNTQDVFSTEAVTKITPNHLKISSIFEAETQMDELDPLMGKKGYVKQGINIFPIDESLFDAETEMAEETEIDKKHETQAKHISSRQFEQSKCDNIFDVETEMDSGKENQDVQKQYNSDKYNSDNGLKPNNNTNIFDAETEVAYCKMYEDVKVVDSKKPLPSTNGVICNIETKIDDCERENITKIEDTDIGKCNKPGEIEVSNNCSGNENVKEIDVEMGELELSAALTEANISLKPLNNSVLCMKDISDQLTQLNEDITSNIVDKTDKHENEFSSKNETIETQQTNIEGTMGKLKLINSPSAKELSKALTLKDVGKNVEALDINETDMDLANELTQVNYRAQNEDSTDLSESFFNACTQVNSALHEKQKNSLCEDNYSKNIERGREIFHDNFVKTEFGTDRETLVNDSSQQLSSKKTFQHSVISKKNKEDKNCNKSTLDGEERNFEAEETQINVNIFDKTKENVKLKKVQVAYVKTVTDFSNIESEQTQLNMNIFDLPTQLPLNQEKMQKYNNDIAEAETQQYIQNKDNIDEDSDNTDVEDTETNNFQDLPKNGNITLNKDLLSKDKTLKDGNLGFNESSNESDSLFALMPLNFENLETLSSDIKHPNLKGKQETVQINKKNVSSSVSLVQNSDMEKCQDKIDEAFKKNPDISVAKNSVTGVDMEICSSVCGGMYMSTLSCESLRKVHNENRSEIKTIESQSIVKLSNSCKKVKQKPTPNAENKVNIKNRKKMFKNHETESNKLNQSIFLSNPCSSSTPFKSDDERKLIFVDDSKTPPKSTYVHSVESPILPSPEELLKVAENSPDGNSSLSESAKSKKDMLPLALKRTKRVRNLSRKITENLELQSVACINSEIKSSKENCPNKKGRSVNKLTSTVSEATNKKKVSNRKSEKKNIKTKIKDPEGIGELEFQDVPLTIENDFYLESNASPNRRNKHASNKTTFKLNKDGATSKTLNKEEDAFVELSGENKNILPNSNNTTSSNMPIVLLENMTQSPITENPKSEIFMNSTCLPQKRRYNENEDTNLQTKLNVKNRILNYKESAQTEDNNYKGEEKGNKVLIPNKSKSETNKSNSLQNKLMTLDPEQIKSHKNSSINSETIEIKKDCTVTLKELTPSEIININHTSSLERLQHDTKQKTDSIQRTTRSEKCSKYSDQKSSEVAAECETINVKREISTTKKRQIKETELPENKLRQSPRKATPIFSSTKGEGNKSSNSCKIEDYEPLKKSRRVDQINQNTNNNFTNSKYKEGEENCTEENNEVGNKQTAKVCKTLEIDEKRSIDVNATNEEKMLLNLKDNRKSKRIKSNSKDAAVQKIEVNLVSKVTTVNKGSSLENSSLEVQTRKSNRPRKETTEIKNNNTFLFGTKRLTSEDLADEKTGLNNPKLPKFGNDSVTLKPNNNGSCMIIEDNKKGGGKERRARKKPARFDDNLRNTVSKSPSSDKRSLSSREQTNSGMSDSTDSINSVNLEERSKKSKMFDKPSFAIPSKSKSRRNKKCSDKPSNVDESDCKDKNKSQMNSTDKNSSMKSNSENESISSSSSRRSEPKLPKFGNDSVTLKPNNGSCMIIEDNKKGGGKERRARKKPARFDDNLRNTVSKSPSSDKGSLSSREQTNSGMSDSSDSINSVNSEEKSKKSKTFDKPSFAVPSKSKSLRNTKYKNKSSNIDESDCKDRNKSQINSTDTNLSMKSNSENESISSPSSRKSENSMIHSPRRSVKRGEQVLFTGLSNTALETDIKKLGGAVVDCPNSCTVLVTDKVRRTVKFLCVLGQGKPIVTPDWIVQSWRCCTFKEPMNHLLVDSVAEQKFHFSLVETIQKAHKARLLCGYSIHATASVKPPPEDIKSIVESCGGTFLTTVPSTKWPEKSIVISHPDDKAYWRKVKVKGTTPPIVTAEMLLLGILQYKLDIETHRIA